MLFNFYNFFFYYNFKKLKIEKYLKTKNIKLIYPFNLNKFNLFNYTLSITIYYLNIYNYLLIKYSKNLIIS